jgi:hypothetical protein
MARRIFFGRGSFPDVAAQPAAARGKPTKLARGTAR